jgi:hypothetical protein
MLLIGKKLSKKNKKCCEFFAPPGIFPGLAYLPGDRYRAFRFKGTAK